MANYGKWFCFWSVILHTIFILWEVQYKVQCFDCQSQLMGVYYYLKVLIYFLLKIAMKCLSEEL